MSDAKIRLYVEHPLAQGQAVPLNANQTHYLFSVMRLTQDDSVLLFNGYDGEWRATVKQSSKRSGILICAEQTRPLQLPPDLWLLFAPIKRIRTNFIIEKATELGVSHIIPVQTRYTNSDRVRQDRLQAHAVEASEQCGGTYVPKVSDLQQLDQLLATWQANRRILWCDETLTNTRTRLDTKDQTPWAILIGPEGGFSADEAKRLRATPQITPISLGPRILRADTAAVAALTLWQSTLGDW
ncbi:MAG: 16S rRNA (uracil(1498)-N(3))-methyltransferase [Rhodobacteraceae bacterium]|jgi:16S rRNA (uracil1498-N3)-methyltransferase|nr:16S rRNA (uracil(1498)-N(3))-methyltransferase [Paracoccaceae bacterium]